MTLGVGDHRGFPAFEDGYHAVRRAQVDAYGSRHGCLLLC
jgi:hypothetical protein